MLSQFSVKRPYTVIVAVVLVIVLGVISYMGMRTDLLPEIELPYVVVVTAYPGASPEQVEQAATKPLESSLGTVSGLKKISSISQENSSIIILEFARDINMDSAMIELSNNIDMVSARLDSAVGKPMLLRINPEMMPIMVATVDLEGKEIDEVSDFVLDTLLPAFERIDGVASVTAAGLLEKELQVSLNQQKIDRLNEKIIADLEGSLDQTQGQLKGAAAELAAARQKLDDESANQREQLAEAGVKLDGAIANLNALLAEKTILEAQKAAFEKEKEGLAQLAGLQELFDRFPGKVADLSPETYAAIMKMLSPSLPEQLRGLSQKEMAKMQEMAAGAPARIAAIDTELQNISVRLATISAMQPQLEKALKEATAGYQQIESGKVTLSIELAGARLQLENSQAELEKGLSELESARDEARQQADLNNMITAETVSNILKAQNFTMPAGYIQKGEAGHVVKVVGQYDSVESLENTVLFSLESVGDICLSDIADIAVVDNAAQTYAKVDGNDNVILTFQKQSTASTAEVAGKINELADELSEQYPGLHILALMDQGEYINISVSSVLQNLLIGGILAIIVLAFFLKDARPTLVIAFSIPISLMFAVTLMYFSNVSLNVISLSGLALGVGMLVDNSIVVMENIYRLRHEGVPVYKAAVQGARQVSGAIFASTLTTVCVFLPIVFTQGMTRQLFTDMGLTIAYSLLASLAVALTVVPTMASTVLKSTWKKQPRWFEALVSGYDKLIRFSLDHKAPVIGVVVLLFALSIYGVTIMGTGFLPEMDTPQMSATLTMPEGCDQEQLYAMNDEVMTRILEIEDVANVGAISGSSDEAGMIDSAVGDTFFYILLKDNRAMTNREIERLILEKTGDLDAEISVSDSSLDISVLGNGIEVVIKGQDLDLLAATAEEIAGLLRETEGTVDVITGYEDAATETRIIVDRDAAMREGLTVAQVYQQVAAALATETESTTLTAGEAEYPVIVVATDRSEITRDNISDFKLTFNGQDGTEKEVLLGDIAEIVEMSSPLAITRENQSRYVTVTAAIADGYNIGLVSREFEDNLASYTPPPGTSLEVAGENKMINEAMRDIILMIVLAVILIYLVMVAQFQSLLSPLIILFTLPLAFTGGLLLLWVCGLELSVPALLGFLVLAGIVVNNGIVFVDYVNQLRLEGKDKRSALIETGSTRLRPILMTAVTTILAMSTIALGFGSGVEMTQPLAVVTIGGLTYATLLTLLVVPIMYDLLHRRPLNKIDTGE